MSDAVPEPVVVQPVVAPPTSAAVVPAATSEPGGESAVRDVLSDLAASARPIGFRVPSAGLACVTGFGSGARGRLFAGPGPAGLHTPPAVRHRRDP